MDRNAFHRLLAFGLERGASDIHFEVGYPPHYRVHGELLAALNAPALTAEDTEAIAVMLLEERDLAIDLARRFRELDVSYVLAQRGRFRASIFRQRGAIGVVLRLIPIQVRSLAELGLPRVVAHLTEARRGLVLMAGPAGQGKTTALAAMVRHLNETRHAHVVTIEQPIEYLHEPGRCLIVQREVGSDTESFADALAAAMRQDPDVLVLGDLRDPGSAAAALDAADTGHLVLAAVPAADAVSALQHVAGMFEGEARASALERLAGALEAIVSLCLLPVADGRGRVAAAEVLRRTRAVREAIAGGRLGELRELIRKGSIEPDGMQAFDQHLAELVGSGAITRDTALAAAVNTDELARALRGE